ncbi:MAG: TolC family protein, partial [Treponema sp.]|nr:TolC family protein [Treponema sp.]
MKKIFAALAFTGMIFVPAFAQEQEQEKVMTLTVDKAVELAKENSRTLKSAQIDLEMKKRASTYSWNVFLPNVQASFTAARTT